MINCQIFLNWTYFNLLITIGIRHKFNNLDHPIPSFNTMHKISDFILYYC